MSERIASIDGLLDLARRAALAGGRVAQAAFRPPGRRLLAGDRQNFRVKPDDSEVTDADLAAERAVIDVLRAARPRDAFLGEEATAGSDPPVDDPRIIWVIDPIDGTRNFIRGLPHFACSVAAVQAGRPLVGVVYDVCPKVLYSAAAGCGAFAELAAEAAGPRAGSERLVLRSDAVAPSPADPALPLSEPRRRVVAIPSVRERYGEELVHDALQRHVVRNFGAAALHLAYVAAGMLDVTILNNTKVWDIAAGWLLVIEAGGSAERLTGGPVFPLRPGDGWRDTIPCLAGGPRERPSS